MALIAASGGGVGTEDRINRVTDVTPQGAARDAYNEANYGIRPPNAGGGNAQQAFMAQRGIQGDQDKRAMQATQQLLGNPGMHFGQGGGDWASAWTQAQQPKQGIFDALIGNQVRGFTGYGDQLNNLYNSPSGPYGQMQAAAAYTAPARSQRYVADSNERIADRKYDAAESMFGRLSQALQPNVANVETDYGAFAKVMPTIMAKYFPKKK